MLALYIRSEEIPDELKQYTPILSEKPQDPLAFQNLSEEEQVDSFYLVTCQGLSLVRGEATVFLHINLKGNRSKVPF